MKSAVPVVAFICMVLPALAQEAGKVVVLPLTAATPPEAKKLGVITTGNNATQTHCDYEALVERLKDKARRMGGNLVKITQLVEPAFVSRCYKVHAEVYHADQLPEVESAGQKDPDNNNNYATIYLYRLRDTVSPSPSYVLHIDDSELMKMKGRRADSVNICKKGIVTIWAKTEKRVEAKLNVRTGEKYYVRCGVETGQLRMIPMIQIMDAATGAAEYKRLKSGKKDMDVKYLYMAH